MSTIKILAVEDDPIYAESLEMIVHELGYELVQVVDNGADAIQYAKSADPDLILMDIEINDTLSGIELTAKLKNICSAPVIYVTSHDDNETFQKAKLTSPNAYIIKPYNHESLKAAIELALINPASMQKNENRNESFFIKDNGSLYKINPLEILFIESDEKYCTIHTTSRKHTINIRLKELYARLSTQDFIQTHRSFVIRMDAIEKINISEQTLYLPGKEIPIGKSFKDELFGKLNYL